MSYALYLLATNPEVQQYCVDEVSGIDVLEDPAELAYCTAVVLETLRLFPPAIQTTRTVGKAKTLSGGYVVQPDTFVSVSIWTIHRDEKIFPNPHEFRPDRWAKLSEESSEHKKKWVARVSSEEPSDEPGCTIAAANRKAFFPFSAGGRSCAGMKFAMDEAVIVLANLVKHLKFSPSPGFELEIELRGILQMPKNGVSLIVEERAKN